MSLTCRALPLSLCALLLGCPARKDEAAKPTAAAGADQVAWKGDEVALDGSASSDPGTGTLRYQWRQLEGPSVALAGDQTARATFRAPHQSAALRFSLEVNGAGGSATDELVVEVRNRAPRAAAGADQVVSLGRVVALDGAGSSDPDGDPLTVSWAQRSGPPVTLQPHPGASATFTAPAQAAVLEFGLVVSDGEATSAEDVVRITVLDASANWPPTASAGLDQTVPKRALVTLSGSASDREHDPLTWSWTQVAGPPVALLGASGPNPTFAAPAAEADLEFELVVADPFAPTSDRVLVQVRNQAPAIRSLALGPPSPVTTDELVASLVVVDADGDPLAVTWEWRRNGAVLAGQATPRLSPSLTTKGDVLVARVSVSDGVATTSGEASATILDSPPALALQVPVTAAWGQPFTFAVTASDADGDPVGDVLLLHGPAGMAVTPGGAGTWTPTLPMFEASQQVHFSVGIAGVGAAQATAAVRVEDPARALPLYRTGFPIPVWQNGLWAGDQDGDGKSELLVASGRGLYELAHTAGGYAQRWAYPFLPALEGSPTAVDARDLDGDGKAEIFLAISPAWYSSSTGGALLKLDGASRREVARASLGCADVELADLEGDGAVELVCLAALPYGTGGAQQKLVVLDAATLAAKWETAPLALGQSLCVGNVVGDAAREIVAAGGYVFDATGTNLWAYSEPFGQAVGCGDLDGDGLAEIVGMDSWSRVRGFSASLKSPLWEKSTSDNDALLLADVDGDGKPEIVVGDGQWGNVTAYRYRVATNDLAVVLQVNSQDHGVSSIAAGDLDGDGTTELAWGTGASSSGADILVVAGGRPLAVEWRGGGAQQLDGPFLGALPARTAAGAAPGLLYHVPSTASGYGGSRLARLDPVSGALAIGAEVATNWSRIGALAVADYDGDGVDEAFLSTASYYDPYFVGWDFAAGRAEWSSGAGMGSGVAMTAADLNGDGAPDLVTIDSAGLITAHDVAGSALLWKSTSLGSGTNDVEVADVDGDGRPEIVALGGGKLVVFRRATSGPTPWLEAASVAVAGTDLAVGDCDGDGAPELYVLVGDYSGGNQVARYDGALKPLGSFAVSGAVSLFVEELGAPRKNLLLARGSSYPYAGASVIEAVDPIRGDLVWRSPPLWGTVPRNSLSSVDLGPAGRRIAFGTSLGMYVTGGR